MIEIVTHAFAGDLPQYAVFLRTQLSSLAIYTPNVDYKVTVCCNDGDDHVMRVAEENDCSSIQFVFFSEADLFRRAIGRNWAALRTQADLVWFTDVDHIFGRGCLDALWVAWHRLYPRPAMVYPATVLVHRTHAIGDAFCKAHCNGHVIKWDDGVDDFAPKTYRRAIGGVQIVGGDFARQHGYLNGHRKWQTPTDGLRPFPDFRDDVAYRKFCAAHGGVQRIEIPHLYRMRHTAVTYK